jgi:hypothetical protein
MELKLDFSKKWNKITKTDNSFLVIVCHPGYQKKALGYT